MSLPYYFAISDFRPSISISPKVRNMDATMWEEFDPLTNTYQNTYLKGKNDCAQRSGTNTIFGDFDPPGARG